VSYSLHKYLRLATKGNPTALLPLYAPADSVITVTELGRELRALAPKVLSRAAVHRFLGYLDAQRQRFQIERELAASRTAVLRSSAALYKAMGE